MTKAATSIGIMLLLSVSLTAQTGIPAPGMSQCDVLFNNFLNTYSIPSATVAITKDGKQVYMRAFGKSDVAGTTATQPYNLFRIASLSKQITAIAIMKLVESGQLSLSAKVFGTGGILQNFPGLTGVTITDTRIYDITVQQLLEHTAGWNRDINCFPNPTSPYPWFYGGCDPIAVPMHVAQQTGTANPVSKVALIRFLLQKGLNTAPGAVYNYSNIGYLMLGRVIEQISGLPYETYVQNNIFTPLGICDMKLGKNLKADKQEREGEYVGNGYTTYSLYNTGQLVPWEYGGFSVEAMDAHGGWIATANDMIKLLVAIDSFSTKPDILTGANIHTMVTPSTVNANYAKGWQVNQYNNWWHTGALDGTASIQARSSNGYTWAIILNKRAVTNTANFWNGLDALPWNCIAATTNWPSWDLMLSPTTNSSSISFTNNTGSAVTLNWTAGNGDRRIVVARKGAAINAFPADGTDYPANATMSSGTNLGNGNFVVYDGAGSSATITNLQPDSTYYFRIFDYRKSTATGNNALYLRCNSTEASVRATGALPVSLGYFTAKAISMGKVSLQWQTLTETNSSHFELEKSSDGSNFTFMQKVAAVGNSHEPVMYNATDHNPEKGANYYRLKQIDKDGKETVYPIRQVQIAEQAFQVYPTISAGTITIEAESGAMEKATVSIIDMAGKTCLQQMLKAPVSQISLNTLTTGTYIVKVVSAQGIFTQKITKQ